MFTPNYKTNKYAMYYKPAPIFSHASFFKLLKQRLHFFGKPMFAQGNKTRAATTTRCFFNITLLDGLLNLVNLSYFTSKFIKCIKFGNELLPDS